MYNSNNLFDEIIDQQNKIFNYFIEFIQLRRK